MKKLLDDALAAGFEIINGDIFAGTNVINDVLAKFAALQHPQWISIEKDLPTDNKKILVGKYHDDFGWYWIVSGLFDEGKFYLGITDDEFSLQTEVGYQQPTHWMPLPPIPINTEVT